MTPDAHRTIQPRHLKRRAYLYVRQSTLRQVLENGESTKRQYDLRQRAITLGWPSDQVIVIDTDLGQSGASAVDREGFQRLVSEVSLGRAGIVMGLEVSRLARNSADWHRLLEICALTDTLLLDEDGIYDPAHFNDRLVLGLKGTMSEAELHILKARLRGGILNKARRGELEIRLPIGFVYDPAKRVQFDPDTRIRAAVEMLFNTFARVGSASATVKVFAREGLHFPRHVRGGPHAGEVVWAPLEHSRVLQALHNPRYAGVYCFGRTRQSRRPDGVYLSLHLPQDEWTACHRDAHPGYVTWETYEANVAQLRANAAARGRDRRQGPPREGPALLQGLVLCGRCGDRMTVRYQVQRTRIQPIYACQREGIAHAQPICQQLPGAELDAALGRLLIETVTPLAIEVALSVQQEVHARLDDARRLRRLDVERAQYEADLARRRYLQVDPANRHVADALETDWNAKLREVHDVEQRAAAPPVVTTLTEAQRAGLATLASDFGRLWADPQTPDRERKRLARLLLADVTLTRTDDGITVGVRFSGGTTQTLRLPLPKPSWALRLTPTEIVAMIDEMLETQPDDAIAAALNARGLRSGGGRRFHTNLVLRVRQSYGLRSHYDRLRARGLLTLAEMAAHLGIEPATLKDWRRAGLIQGHRYDGRGLYLFEVPAVLPVKFKHKLRGARDVSASAPGPVEGGAV
jgi:DNA invertase Pin-like site-specific DNA recombinase